MMRAPLRVALDANVADLGKLRKGLLRRLIQLPDKAAGLADGGCLAAPWTSRDDA
jgi:hypothetical protein